MCRVLLTVIGVCVLIEANRFTRDDTVTNVIKDTESRVLKKLNSSASENSTIDTCGGIFTQPQFLIETPNYPSNYRNNLDCLFIFKGPYCETNYTLQFLDFNVEDSLGCHADRLEIKYKDALCGTHEGMKHYVTRTGALELNFVSNPNVSARGFRILVSRSQCLGVGTQNQTEGLTPPTTTTTTTSSPIAPDSINPYPSGLPNHPYLPPYPPIGQPSYPPAGPPPFNPHGQACCASTYSAKRFYVSSPGFPYSHNNPTECTFTVYKSSPKVCRARIHFHFFWVGENDMACTNGYLQIDGKLICGCRTGMKLLSPFDATFGNTKVFRFKNLGIPKSVFSGFAIEVIQDECPERYTPPERTFNFYNDQIDGAPWPNMSHEDLILRAQAINDNTEIFEPVDLGFKPRVVKHVYYFDSPSFFDDSYDVSYTFNKPRDVEETTYVDTSDLSTLYPNPYDNSKCRMWGLLQWTLLNKDPLWQRMPKCNDISNHHVMSKCTEYNFIKGYFQSPGYPHYYPKNLNVCYRFSKQRGFCKIRLMILDFQVDESYDCSKDYLLINKNFRYCGQSLANTFTLFDMLDKNYEEIRFITDGRGSGRGFRGIYEQIPCDDGGHPPHVFTTKPPPPLVPPPTTTQFPEQSCSRMIDDHYFTIDIYGYGKDTCDFVVRRSSSNTCRLEITLVTFELSCDVEFLVIKQERYCGRLSGRILSFNFDGNDIPMTYKRLPTGIMGGAGLKIHLTGRQFDCEEKIPPAQRVLQGDRRADVQQVDGNSTLKMEIVKEGEGATVISRKKYDEVCGIVMNLKAPNATDDSICKLLIDTQECSVVSDRAVYVPYNNSDKLELKFKNAETVRDVEFKEITCDNKFIL